MNRYYFSSTPASLRSRQPLAQAPPVKPAPHDRFHSRNSSDPQEYHRRPPPRFDDDDTEEADEDEEDVDMAEYSPRSGAHNASSGGSRPGSSSKESGPLVKKAKTKSTKVFQCTGYGDCHMQFTRSEHLARHIR
jgi:hypothetical protein